MNYYEAHQILNEVKDGVDHPVELITHALYLTGDLEIGVRGETLHPGLQRHQSHEGTRSRFWMVGPKNI